MPEVSVRMAVAEEMPSLVRLNLTSEEWAAIRRQGFVSREQHRGQTVFKLRFRTQDKRQHVHSLGRDPCVALAVQAELAEVQRLRRLDLRMGKLEQQINRKLREQRKNFAPQLEQAGFYFHGSEIRQRRLATE